MRRESWRGGEPRGWRPAAEVSKLCDTSRGAGWGCGKNLGCGRADGRTERAVGLDGRNGRSGVWRSARCGVGGVVWVWV
jgi:hypothetical protein